MGSRNMAVVQVVCICLVVVVAGQEVGTLPETTTPVPILRYIDQQNRDGSYTYGFEAGDGTYKIETREVDGQVRGKYGYYDPEGVLREATYGATSKSGFQPQINGVLLPPVYTVEEDIQNNEIINQVDTAQRKFSNFVDRKPQKVVQSDDVKLVNGRRAVLKRRLVKKPVLESFEEEISPEERLRTRQHQLKQLREHRRQLVEVQQRHIQRNQVQERHIQRNQVQSYSQDQDQEAFRSFRAQPQIPQYQRAGPTDPFVTHGAQFGSYSIRY